MTAKKQVAVLGGGSFGTVLANIAASNGYQVSLWVRDAEQALRINSEGANATYHPELRLSDNITADEDLASVIMDAQFILVATPSIIFEEVISRLEPLISPSVTVISCTKGIKSQPFRTMTDIITQHLGHIIGDKVGVLSGPNLAKEIAEEKLAGTVIACENEDIAFEIKSMLSSNTFKVFSSQDIQGVELAGALKNIYAICCGIAHAKLVGENALGFIVTRSMAEMSRFAVAKGANPITFLGLAGMGDLMATCTSKLSRNFQLGELIAEDLSLFEAKERIGQVAEGAKTLEVVYHEARKMNVKMPLVTSLYEILYSDASSEQLIQDLLDHPNEVDVEFTYKEKL
ncbi:NAD(P)-dependent glycerol-3-phosphate dehydrogenase [Gammaproteobacteria bacterium]|jgi:glycerol-3-phosphate dehydrogenase (NAD(P)+)|nr:NAD(P)-dependent glycerol-3-phosphate dehydrogenase [Gammaproteobacteria bacterium]MDC0332581.1 NAD(P)-dependent glycerol-3-phosphate dehydrogenase [Gammaproteobacteria bacterium]MDC0919240.1 NAD(P)-dependent glycerol-3-phosphate dehydrogenase [Gammaproteobacteria bacterium]MDC3222668.1 NAD(P)-dependent glycerol-3-phosphate dehydrogenase [Gammaproteobacteria bacterium]